jgi:hypothetical protein
MKKLHKLKGLADHLTDNPRRGTVVIGQMTKELMLSELKGNRGFTLVYGTEEMYLIMLGELDFPFDQEYSEEF